MELVKKLEVENQVHVNSKRLLDIEEEKLARNEEKLNKLKERLGKYKAQSAQEVIQALDDAMRDAASKKLNELCPGADENITVGHHAVIPAYIASAINEEMDGETNIQYSIDASLNTIIQLKQQLALNPSEKFYYDADNINKQLLEIDDYVNNSAWLSNENGTNSCVHFAFKDIVAYVDNFDVPTHFHIDGERIPVPIGDVWVKINLISRVIEIDGPQQNKFYRWEGSPAVHPHVLSFNQPCLGDFAGPIAEAISEQDWNSVGTLLQLFLTRIDNRDSAGRNWIVYFSNTFRRDPEIRNRIANESQNTAPYMHYFFECGKWDVKMSCSATEYKPKTPDTGVTEDATAA
jgi:predicted DNA-binding protein